MAAVFVVCPDCGRLMLGQQYGSTVYPQPHQCKVRSSPAEQARADVECGSCGEGLPTGECPKSKRSCGHHCNHVWTHDACDWCGVEFLGDGEVHTPSGVSDGAP